MAVGDGKAAARGERARTTTGMIVGVYGFAIFAIVAFLVGYAMYSSLGSQLQFLAPIGIAIFLGVVTPVTVIAIRHQIRLTRIRFIELFGESLGLPTEKMTAEQVDATVTKLSENKKTDTEFELSFEFVKGKYYADLELKENEKPTLDRIPRFPMMLRSDWMLLLCAIPFMVASVFGTFLLFAPLVNVMDYDGASKFPLWPSVLTLGGSPTLVTETKALFAAQHANTVTIAALAFAGAFFYSVRLMLRAVAVFDLSPITFLRCFAHVVLAVLLAVVIYRVTPSAEGVASFVTETRFAWNLLTEEEKKAAKDAKDAKSTTGDGPVASRTTPKPPAAPAGAAPPPPPAPAAGDPAPGAPSPAPGSAPNAAPSSAPNAAPGAPASATTPAAVDAAKAKEVAQTAGVAPATDGVKSFWLILAFALGFLPEAALEYVLKKSGVNFKQRYGALEHHSKTIPLTVLDGVDHYIAFRLEEANIFDVQNLATANPIMLHIETPYGIYQTIDWVAQAQLCTVVGPERFLALKTINIRTIFDLERGVLTKNIADEIVRMIGATLLSDSNREKAARYDFGVVPSTLDNKTPAQPLTGLTEARKDISVLGVKQLVWLMIDDLHVHRLRQIWKFIGRKLDPQNRNFNSVDDEPAPT